MGWHVIKIIQWDVTISDDLQAELNPYVYANVLSLTVRI